MPLRCERQQSRGGSHFTDEPEGAGAGRDKQSVLNKSVRAQVGGIRVPQHTHSTISPSLTLLSVSLASLKAETEDSPVQDCANSRLSEPDMLTML